MSLLKERIAKAGPGLCIVHGLGDMFGNDTSYQYWPRLWVGPAVQALV